MEKTSDLTNLRNDLSQTRRLLEEWLPTLEDRQAILGCLATSIRIAHERSTGKRWGVTLDPRFVRLTVGMVNQFQVDREGGAFFMAFSEHAPAATGTESIARSNYKNLPSSWVVSGPAHDVAVAFGRLAAEHAEAVKRAATTQFQPSVHHSHSPAVLQCLRDILHEAVPNPSWSVPLADPAPSLLQPYVRVSEDVSLATQESRTPNLALTERGLLAHRSTQNHLADFLEKRGLTPMSPVRGGPAFDVAWRNPEGVLCVAEVKSITDGNANDQLRIGLGQVLEYRFRLSQHFLQPVHAYLIVEAAPADMSWSDICAASDVKLAWAPDFPLLP